MSTFNLSQKELSCMIILERIKNEEITQENAAKLLKLSVRRACAD